MEAVKYVQPGSEYLKTSEEKAPDNEMNKDAFMNLLVTQMKYQDPLNPMDNQEMMAQLAQFTALEQMMNVAMTSEKQLAHGLIGKYVQYQYTDTTTGQTNYFTGHVDYVKTSGKEAIIGIGEKEVKLDEILEVFDSSNIQTNTSPFGLIGKTVQGSIKEKIEGSEKEEDVIIEGEVLGINMKDGEPFLVIGTGKEQKEINFKDVQNIVSEPSITGKWVKGIIYEEEAKQEIEGIAEYIAMKKDGTYVYVNGKFVKFDDITSIGNKPNSDGE